MCINTEFLKEAFEKILDIDLITIKSNIQYKYTYL